MQSFSSSTTVTATATATDVTPTEILVIGEPHTAPRHAFFAGTLPLPPGINGSYQPGSSVGRPIVGTAALHQFKSDAALELSQAYHDWSVIKAIRESRLKVPLRMEIHFYFRSLWKRDIDGGIKAVQDAVFNRMELNDTLVVKLNTEKHEDPERPRVEVEVYYYLVSPLSSQG